MAGRQYEPVAVRPDRIIGIEAKEVLPQRVDHRRHCHRRSWMAGFGLLNRVDAQGADGVDTDFVDRAGGRHQIVPLRFDQSHCGDRADWKRTPTMRATINSISRSTLIAMGFSSRPGGSRVASWLS